MSEEVKQEEQDEKETEIDVNAVPEESTESQEAGDEKSSAEGEAGADGEKTDAEKKIEELEKEVADLKDKYLRSVADFQNLRKRSIQEKQEAYDYANTSLLKDLLDSLDNFDRTVEAAANATDPKSIADGVSMINRSLVSMLENKYNLVSYGEVGDAFDPDIHEAIGKSDDPVAEPVLKAVYLKGYKLKDRVIRHAKVMVSMPDGSVKADEKSADDKAASDSEKTE
ncbi:MAG: nucleotide exchange factor GrpE [Treponema sp.]|nr:nucleotide exchange factor GrpE [Treponema sp.]